MVQALVDALNGKNDVVNVAFDVHGSISVLIHSGMKIYLGVGFAHNSFDILSFLSDEH